MICYNEKSCSKIRQNFQLFIISFFILLSVNLLPAQSSSSRVQGNVVDISNGETLPGASVYFQGTAVGTMTDIEGNFKISNVSPGKYDLVVSYIGYKKQVISIVVSADKTLTLEVKLESAYVQGQEIVVSAQLQGQAQAINRQISSDQIVNIVSEQKIKELPDANAAESVGRLPGVAVQRDGGEASKLMIRGLDPRFTNVTLNGIQMPATNPESRDVDLSLISQSTLSGIELFKALTPDQDADAIAGVVNLVTGQAKAGQKISFDLFGIYSGMNKTTDQFKVAGQYSNRFFDDLLGVQAGLGAEKRDRSSELFANNWDIKAMDSQGFTDYEISSGQVEYDHEIRKRYSGNLNLDFSTGDGGSIKLINLYSKTTRKQFISSRTYPANGTVTYIGEAIDRNIFTWNNSLNGENHLFGVKIDWALSHAYTKNEKPFDHWMRFYENTTTSSGMRAVNNKSELKLPGSSLIKYAWNAFNKATLDRAFFYTDSNDERNYDAKIDLEYPIRLSDDFAGIFKTGYKYRDKTRNRNTTEQMTSYWLRSSFDNYLNDAGQIVRKDWANSSWPNGYHGLLTDFMGSSSRTINEDYILNPVLDENLNREWYEFSRTGISTDGLGHEYFNHLTAARDQYNVEEAVQGAYAMIKLNAGQLVTLIAGVRYESESNIYKAKFAPRIIGEFETQSGIITDTTSYYKKDFFLPNIHLKIKPLEWLDFRFAVSKSISRPDYSMRLPTLYINNQDAAIQSGNPNLEPAVAWNYDASVSLYSTQYGLLTISGFRKEIDNIFYWLNDIKIMSNDQATSLGLPVDKYGPFNQYLLRMPVNTEGTKVWGFELDMQTHLGFLPGVLSNIVVSANYSKMWSKTKYPRFTLVQQPGFPPKPPVPTFYETERELSGQTDYTGNVSVGYDYAGFSGRVSAYFQGPYLVSINTIESRDVYQKAFSRWDLSLKQHITDNITTFLNVLNFANVIEGSKTSYLELDNGGRMYGVTAELGLQLSL
jgi:TonB-dependent receptor